MWGKSCNVRSLLHRESFALSSLKLGWRLGKHPFRLALLGSDGLDAARTHVGTFLVLRMTDRNGSTLLSILSRLESLCGFTHAFRNALSVPACWALSVMSDKDGLTERDTVRDAADLRTGALGFVSPALLVDLDLFGGIFHAVEQ